MATTASATIIGGAESSVGIEAVQKLKSIDPASYLSKSQEISEAARLASEYLFASLKPYAPKSPFPELLVNGFDAEQIWQQIDIQSQPLISTLRRKVQHFEKNPKEIKRWFNVSENDKSVEEKKIELDVKEKEIEDFDDEDVTAFGDDDEEDDEDVTAFGDDDEEDDKDVTAFGDDEDEDDEDEDEDDKMEEENEEEKQNLGYESGEEFEDKFLKMNELEDYMEKDEARETKKRGKKRSHNESADEEESEEEEEEEGVFTLNRLASTKDVKKSDEDEGLNARYKDFFGDKGKDKQKRKSKSVNVSDHLDMDKELSDDDNNKKKEKLSTHEKEQLKIRSTVEEMEIANLKPKSWVMQGEVTAAKRPINSALGVDIDFERNVRPPPVITDEVTASLEELILKRIVEGRFDDVQKPPTLPSRAPREIKQLDENKSDKGLGDIYAEDYAKTTGLVSVAVTISDQQKKEAKLLFKELCLKLDALSHFHFTPKPVIEDMSIQVNVPALAMEEIAPLAVSDASMLAPEEVFAGKGDIKEETELTQSDRKRRRAKKKRKFKANAAKMPAKSQPTPPQSNIDHENKP